MPITLARLRIALKKKQNPTPLRFFASTCSTSSARRCFNLRCRLSTTLRPEDPSLHLVASASPPSSLGPPYGAHCSHLPSSLRRLQTPLVISLSLGLSCHKQQHRPRAACLHLLVRTSSSPSNPYLPGESTVLPVLPSTRHRHRTFVYSCSVSRVLVSRQTACR